VVKVQKPSAAEAEALSDGSLLVAFLQPLTDAEGIERLAARGVTGFAMESIPRITRAQPMDALSSQATVSGYKAVLLAAERLPRFFPMLMTAGGTVAPAGGARGADWRLRRRRDDGARSGAAGAAADSRRCGSRNAPRVGDRRPGRGGGRELRADGTGRDRRAGRRDHRRADEPAELD